MNKLLQQRKDKLESMAKEMGIDFFPIDVEVVPEEVMLEVISYGLPTRIRHWQFGQSYEYQKLNGEMGHSKIYEVIFNNDPAKAFLLDSNSDTENTLVLAHIIGHSAFFKNNYMFKETDRQMVYHAAERAARVDQYIEKYGIDSVEHIMNIGFALESNIDWHKGFYRKPFPKKKKVLREKITDEFEDLLGSEGPSHQAVILNTKFPPSPEKDILWFVITYAKGLEDWQKDILSIIREESFYFYPQFNSKIANEGLASFVHAELMSQFDEISEREHLDFARTHEKVVQPGSNKLNINPYFLGFSILKDIRERWDEKFKNDDFLPNEPKLTGIQKILRVTADENDSSFIRNYLTQELVEELDLFAYKRYFDSDRNEYLEVKSSKVEDVIESLTEKMHTYRGAPDIAITKASHDGLELEHLSTNVGTLDGKHIERVLGYLFELWGAPVDLKTVDDKGEVIHLTYDEEGLSDPDFAEEVTEKVFKTH